MKTAHRIIANTESASEAMDDAESAVIYRYNNLSTGLAKYMFADCSVLVFRGCDYFAFDSKDEASIAAYADWIKTDDEIETAYIRRLLAQAY
ncbi:hypothetical protein D3C84_917370 [compost metagenome]